MDENKFIFIPLIACLLDPKMKLRSSRGSTGTDPCHPRRPEDTLREVRKVLKAPGAAGRACVKGFFEHGRSDRLWPKQRRCFVIVYLCVICTD